MNVYDFACISTSKALAAQNLLAVFIKDVGCFAFFYGGTAVFAKYWG